MTAHALPKATLPKGANGQLTLNLGWRGAWQRLRFYGGPYDRFPQGQWFGVCVRAERVPAAKAVHLPIHDFQVPDDDAAVEKALRQALQAALDGRQVYVGCMGGWGRTGLFLALLAKATGFDNPVACVRAHYTPHAVETEAQWRYVQDFDVRALRRWLRGAAWLAWLRQLKNMRQQPAKA